MSLVLPCSTCKASMPERNCPGWIHDYCYSCQKNGHHTCHQCKGPLLVPKLTVEQREILDAAIAVYEGNTSREAVHEKVTLAHEPHCTEEQLIQQIKLDACKEFLATIRAVFQEAQDFELARRRVGRYEVSADAQCNLQCALNNAIPQ